MHTSYVSGKTKLKEEQYSVTDRWASSNSQVLHDFLSFLLTYLQDTDSLE